MRKENITCLRDAFAYLADCQLATVAHTAMRKRKSKSEYRRQISIAQTFCDWAYAEGIMDPGNRLEDVRAKGNNVSAWAKEFEPDAGRVPSPGGEP